VRAPADDRHISADAKNVGRVSNKDFDAYLAQEDEPTLKGAVAVCRSKIDHRTSRCLPPMRGQKMIEAGG
jgi:hypothetical protein